MSVFISYSHEDREYVDGLSYLLGGHNIKVWRDLWQISPGEDFSTRIEEALRQVTAVCVVVSGHSLNSPWVEREIQAALTRASGDPDFVVLPILRDDIDLPSVLRRRIFVDMPRSSRRRA